MRILAIETSCDETASAVVEDGVKILSNVVASSREIHEKYGGIVPELAAREQLRCILPVIREALAVFQQCSNVAMKQCIEKNIDAVAITVGPGLIGSLLVGVETAKTIAFVAGKPIIPVNHVLGHIYANFVESYQSSAVNSQTNKKTGLKAESRKLIAFPAIALVASGGHTELYLMESIKELRWLGGTLDDAAGEAFDKSARLLGFGAGGGPAIERTALKFKVQSLQFKVHLPRPMMQDESLNFSFSGLKTAVLREWKKYQGLKGSDPLAYAFAHEVQEAITDVLVEKTTRAAKQFNARSILLSGGVAANKRLREKFNLSLIASHLLLFAPPPALCTDNAAMIGSCAYFRGKPKNWKRITATPDLSVEEKQAY